MLEIIKKVIWKNLPDKLCLKRLFYRKLGKNLNLKNPTTFNEKLQRLKIYNRNNNYTKMVDKYESKKYVKDIIGEEYIIPTLGIYNTFDEINFSKLPKQFVLKCTHDSGSVIIVKDKHNLEIESIRKKINKSLKNNLYYWAREWPYKNVKPRIIIEPYLEDGEYNELRDYKFFIFDGKCKIMFIASNRQGEGETYFDFYDNNFKHLDIINGHPNAPIPPQKPKQFDKMIKLAEKLGKKLIHIRVDFYEINGKIYFGEMTFYHRSGLVPFEPEERDYKLGEYIELKNSFI